MPSWTGGTFAPDAGTLLDQHCSSSMSLTVDKQQHAYKAETRFGFAIGATPTTREEIVFVATGSGVIRSISAMLNDTGTSTSITFDLKKNGVSILTGVITITHSNSDRQVLTGTLSSTTYVAGDVLSIAMTVSSSTGAQGPYAWAGLSEAIAP